MGGQPFSFSLGLKALQAHPFRGPVFPPWASCAPLCVSLPPPSLQLSWVSRLWTTTWSYLSTKYHRKGSQYASLVPMGMDNARCPYSKHTRHWIRTPCTACPHHRFSSSLQLQGSTSEWNYKCHTWVPSLSLCGNWHIGDLWSIWCRNLCSHLCFLPE